MAMSSRVSSADAEPTTVALAWPSGQLALAKGPPEARTIHASEGSIASKARARRASSGDPDFARFIASGKCRHAGSRRGGCEPAGAGRERSANRTSITEETVGSDLAAAKFSLRLSRNFCSAALRMVISGCSSGLGRGDRRGLGGGGVEAGGDGFRKSAVEHGLQRRRDDAFVVDHLFHDRGRVSGSAREELACPANDFLRGFLREIPRDAAQYRVRDHRFGEERGKRR